MKKFLSVLAVLALVGSLAFAQEAEESNGNSGSAFFQNTVKTNVVVISNSGAAFNYIWEDMKAGYNSDKLDIFAKGRIKLMTSSGVPVAFGYVSDETYFGINYKPVKGLELGIGQSIVIPGAYLAVEDDDLEYGKLGVPGFDICVKAVDGLTLVAAFDFLSGVYNNYFVDSFGNYVFNTRFGGWYEYSKENSDFAFTIGAAFRYNNGNPLGAVLESNPYHAGAYATITPIKDLTFYMGYSYNVDDALYITGDHVFNFSATYEYNDFACAFDYQSNTAGDLYSGAYFGYTIKDFTPEIAVQFSTTYADFANGWFGIYPDVAWKINKNHKLVCGVAVEFDGGAWDQVNFPIKWVYKM